jgi:hypothetical protein
MGVFHLLGHVSSSVEAGEDDTFKRNTRPFDGQPDSLTTLTKMPWAVNFSNLKEPPYNISITQ